MPDYFDELLAIIFDSERSLNPSRLSELSDPTREHLDIFRTAWFQAEPTRRFEISQQLHDLARDNFEMLFDRINMVLLDDPEPRIREQAIENLWESEDPKLASILAKISRTDSHPGVKQRAAQALGRFIYLGEMDKLPPAVIHEVETALTALLTNTEASDLQRQALQSLGYSSSIELESHIEDAYHSGDEAQILSSIIAMGRSADPKWRGHIEAHINDPSPPIRAEAATAIGEIQSRGSASLLVDLLDDPKLEVRKAAIWSLGQVGGDSARKALERLSEAEESGELQNDIQESLEYIAFLEATPDLMMFDLGPEDQD